MQNFLCYSDIWLSDLWLEESISNWRIAIPNFPVLNSFVEDFRVKTLDFVNHADVKICARPFAAMKWENCLQTRNHARSTSQVCLILPCITQLLWPNIPATYSTQICSHTRHTYMCGRKIMDTPKVCKWYQFKFWL